MIFISGVVILEYFVIIDTLEVEGRIYMSTIYHVTKSCISQYYYHSHTWTNLRVHQVIWLTNKQTSSHHVRLEYPFHFSVKTLYERCKITTMSFAPKRKGPIKCLNQFKQTMDRRAIFILCTGAYICIHKHASSCICRLYRNEGAYIQILIFWFFFYLFGMATFQ